MVILFRKSRIGKHGHLIWLARCIQCLLAGALVFHRWIALEELTVNVNIAAVASSDAGLQTLASTKDSNTATKKITRIEQQGLPRDFTLQNLSHALQEYITFHKSQVNHSSSSPMPQLLSPQTPYIQYVGRNGGLGDRIGSIFATFYLALCTNRLLLIRAEWIQDYLQPRWIEWQATPHPQAPKASKLVSPRGHIYRNPSELEESLGWVWGANNHWAHHHDELLNTSCMKNIYDDDDDDTNYSNNNNTIMDHRRVYFQWFWTLFQFTDKVKEYAQTLRTKAGLLDNDNGQHTRHESALSARKEQPYIAVHIRTGDSHFDLPAERHIDRESEFFACAQKIQQGLTQCLVKESSIGPPPQEQKGGSSSSPSSPLIYIASDNPHSKDLFQSYDPSTIRQVREMEIFHVARSLRTNVKDANLGELTVWAELLILIESTCLVYSRSGYSETAAWTGGLSRCAVRFDQCGDAEVVEALSHVGCVV